MLKVYSYWKDWFEQPPEEKSKFLREPGRGGWYPPYSESPGYGEKDAKEYFHYVRDGLIQHTETDKLLTLGHGIALQFLQKYNLGHLGYRDEFSKLRILRYFPQKVPHGQAGWVRTEIKGEAHVDYSLLTVAFPTTPGLMLHGLNGWECANLDRPKILIGEMLELHTEGLFKATKHKIQVLTQEERYAIIFFYLPPENFEISPGYTARSYWDDRLSKAGTKDIGT